MKNIITVFTPLYNRSKSIYKVYESLCNQSCYDFEWLVINDGSNDGSDVIMNNILKNHKYPFPISFFSQENKGLTRTINRAIDLAQGILFFRLDSDDYALPDAICNILSYYHLIDNNKFICSITFLSQTSNGEINGSHPFKEIKRSNFAEYRDRYKATGDRAEIMKVDIYKEFKYPEIPNEKFCPEGIVWNRIAKQYDTIYVPLPIYVKDNPDDSITANVYNYLKRNAKGVALYYSEIMNNYNFSFRYRFINAIKYYRYAYFAKAPIIKNTPLLMLLAIPLAWIVILIDIYRKQK